MSDAKKLEERLNNLEAKLKAAFADIEARIGSMSNNDISIIEERFQEMEDLILILQVEQMKIKEKLQASADIGFGEIPVVRETAENKETFEKSLDEIEMRLSALETTHSAPALAKNEQRPVQMQQSSGLLLEINKILNSN